MTPPSFAEDPAFVVALALVVGMTAQVVARHLRLPGIVLLLAAGALLGPDGLGWIQPQTLGGTLQTLVGFAVAVILFEGGLSLNIRRLRRQAKPIRGLVTIGSFVTAVGGTLAAHYIMGWAWSVAALFGTLVIVTGPTVINPLLRRLRVESKVSTVLEAEGIFGDAIGALVAIVALEVVLTPAHIDVAHGAWELLQRIGFGGLAGVLAGLVMATLLRYERLIPHGLDNMVTLSLTLLLYQGANALLPESGIVAVIAAGMTIGNTRAPLVEELKEFKEQLTAMLIGLLFVLLAADVRLDDVKALGWRGLATVGILMLIVRPLNVWVGTYDSDLNLRQKAFLSWMAPRGIVAAAVASLFAQRLEAAEMTGGTELRALVFLVIALTVTVQGLMGAPLATLLGLKRKSKRGYAILGAGPLARTLAEALGSDDQKGVLIDSNPQACRTAELSGLKILFGSGLADSILQRAALEERRGAIGLTPNDGINFTFTRRAKREFRSPKVWLTLGSNHSEVRPSMLGEIEAELLFGGVTNIGVWNHRVEQNRAVLEIWEANDRGSGDQEAPTFSTDQALPFVWRNTTQAEPFAHFKPPFRHASLLVLVASQHTEAVEAAMSLAGWYLTSTDAINGERTRNEESA